MRKVGELKGKPIIEGNPNEIKNNQIHAKIEEGGITLSERKNGSLETISGGSSGGGGNNIEYYTFNINNVPESWTDIIPILLSIVPLCKYTYKPINENIEKYIIGSGHFIDNFNKSGITDIIAIAYMPTYLGNIYAYTLKDLFIEIGLDITDFDKVFKPITKEEFYDLNKWSLEDYK